MKTPLKPDAEFTRFFDRMKSLDESKTPDFNQMLAVVQHRRRNQHQRFWFQAAAASLLVFAGVYTIARLQQPPSEDPDYYASYEWTMPSDAWFEESDLTLLSDTYVSPLNEILNTNTIHQEEDL